MVKDHKDLYAGFNRLHILHHAAAGPIYGQWIMEELARHGYKLSSGTLYPLLHGMEKKGYLRSAAKRVERTVRREYRATAEGRRALRSARKKVQELFGEMFEKE